MDPELKAYLDGMRQDLMAHAEQLNTQTRQDLHRRVDEIHQRIDDTTRETRQHAEQLNHETRVLMEDMRQQIQLIAEGVTTVRDQLGRIIADHEERITRLERRRMS